MDQPVKPFTSDGADTRRWIGRLIIAVILGEAIWGLIVSFMNHVFVPWLGDVMGHSSGLPTSFTQRPYNYPELFVSVFEFCIAGLVAAVLNFLLQRPAARRVKTVKSTSPPGPVRVISQTMPSSAPTETAPPQFGITPVASPVSTPAQEAKNVSGDSVHSCPGSFSRAGCAGRASTRAKARGICSSCTGRPETRGVKTCAARAQGRTGQAEEAQKRLLQHCWGAHAFGRRLRVVAQFGKIRCTGVILRDFSPEGSRAHQCQQNGRMRE